MDKEEALQVLIQNAVLSLDIMKRDLYAQADTLLQQEYDKLQEAVRVMYG